MYSQEDIINLKQQEFERREKRLENAVPQRLIDSDEEKNKLHITYVMTWTGICGGSKIILEHANKLTSRGHKITLISHDVKPTWFPLDEAVEFIEVPYEEVLCEKIPACDLIVTTYWREIYESIEQEIAPVIYFEQGDYHLFDLDRLDDRTYNFINKQLETVQYVYTVSTFAREKMKEIYHKDSKVIPNAVDKNVFYYEERPKNEIINIAMIGAENAHFKRIENILEAIRILREEGYQIKLNWITPTEPVKNKIDAIVNPKQSIIGDTLRKSDIYVCASMYESFCLPVLEAMTCGAAVVTTNNGGNMDFVRDGQNALVIEKDNIKDMCEKIKELLDNEGLRNKLSESAVRTAQEYSWDRTISEIEEYYREVAKHKVQGKE
jgi:glycosyltransferase involved in cell wall biosynthesis